MAVLGNLLTKCFRSIGRMLAKHPNYFIIASIILTVTLSTGLLWIKYDNDTQRLFSHASGRTTVERQIIEKYFPVNYTGAFSPSRITKPGRFFRLIITAKGGGTILNEEIWDEITYVDQLIHSITITYKNGVSNYTDICARVRPDTCYENQVLDIGLLLAKIKNNTARLSYPITFNSESFTSHPLIFELGGLTLSEDNLTVLAAKALNLNYFVATDFPDDDEVGRLWEKSVQISLLSEKWNNINVYQISYYGLISEQEAANFFALPYLSISMILMFTFIGAFTTSNNWARSKPFVGLFATVTTAMGTFAAFGLLCYIGIECAGVNICVPFIMLGIGVDDAFVMLSAWRQTDQKDTVSKRLEDTYAEAAVSITITTLTDMLSFYAGVFTSIPLIQNLSLYSGTSVIFTYIFQIFLFGAILGISGDQEAGLRHSIRFWEKCEKISQKSLKIRKLFGGEDIHPSKTKIEIEREKGSIAMVFFRDQFSEFISNKYTICCVLIVYILYLCLSGWGLRHFNEEFRDEMIFKKHSFLADYFSANDKYFRSNQYRIQVAITSPLDYSKPETKARVVEILSTLTNSSKYVSSEYSENWLDRFEDFVDRNKEYNVATEANFIHTLISEYLPNKIYSEDIAFSYNRSEIIASRFILQLEGTSTPNDCKDAIQKLRKAADSIQDVNVIVFNQALGFVDQITSMRTIALQTLAIAACLVMFVVVLFIPSFITAVVVPLSIVSIEIGVVGISAFWGVDLDLISVCTLIMCIGFSVDFTAHVSHAYIISTGSSKERISKALFYLGLPILQGGWSTLIAVFVLAFMPVYVYNVFFKVFFLVINIAFFHSLFVLPVFFLIVKPESIEKRIRWKSKLEISQAN